MITNAFIKIENDEKFDHIQPRYRYGVLLLNMGGPEAEIEIQEYLYRLFSDPYIVQLPDFFRKLLARVIARFRWKKSATRYALIGGKSPLNDGTAAQAKKLEDILDFPVTYGMRYTRPFVYNGQRFLEDRGINRMIVIPLYPQESRSTTESAVADFEEHHSKNSAYRLIKHHYNNKGFVATLAHLLDNSLKKADPKLNTRVIFVAHSLPMTQIKAGSKYVDQVKETISLVVAEQNNQTIRYNHSLAFQSHIGPVKWQGPSLDVILKQLINENVEQVVVQPVSFVSENLETLYDLDIEFQRQCLNAGIKKFIRVPTPGTHPLYIRALASMVQEEINKWEGRNG